MAKIKCKMCGQEFDRTEGFSELELHFVHRTETVLLCVSCGMKLTEKARCRELWEKPREPLSEIDLRNPVSIGEIIEQEKSLCQKLENSAQPYYLIAIDKNGVMVRRNFELESAAISEAKDFWVNKGFLAVEVFRFVPQGTKMLIETVYHGLRNY